MNSSRFWAFFNLVRWVGPPLVFAVWGVRFLEELLNPAVPAFGSIDAHLARHHRELLQSGALGALIAAGWAVAWTGLLGQVRSGRQRNRRRAGPSRVVRSSSAD